MSAFVTDDWFVRIATLVQMVGVCMLTIGIAPLAHRLATDGHLDNKVMVGGYVIMRLSMVALWLRAAAADPARRRLAYSYAGSLRPHLVALTFAHTSELSSVGVIAAVVGPLALLIGVLFAMTLRILPSGHPVHAWLAVASAVVLALAVGLAAWGVPVPVCLVVTVMAPVAWVVAYETVGHRHVAEALLELEERR